MSNYALGTEVQIRDQKLIIPALSFKDIKQATPYLMSIDKPDTSFENKLEAMLFIIKLAIRRNYDAELLTDAWLESNIDLNNIYEIFQAVVGASELKKKDGDNTEPGVSLDNIDWDSIYAFVILNTNWTWSVVDDLTFPQYDALNKLWAVYPAVQITCQRIFSSITGYKIPDVQSKTPKIEAKNDLQDFIGAFLGDTRGQGIVIEKKG